MTASRPPRPRRGRVTQPATPQPVAPPVEPSPDSGAVLDRPDVHAPDSAPDVARVDVVVPDEHVRVRGTTYRRRDAIRLGLVAPDA